MANPNKLDPAEVLDQALELPGEVAPYYSYFHPYSFTNMVTPYSQGAREIVGTRKQWANVGHTPKPGAERYAIWVPRIIKRPVEGGQESDVEEILTGFSWVPCIYTLSQTEGPQLPEKETRNGWSIVKALGKLGIRQVEFRSLSGNLQGYSRGTEISVSPIAADPFKTTIHEIGHVVLGHTLPHHFEEYQAHRGIMEFQAEGIAYLVTNELGVLDEQTARQSRGYIRHWIRDEKPPEQASRQVLTATDRILKAGRLAVSNTVEGGP